ncbi:hypothetical protein [Sediminibacillus albus]|uniref:Uncharacterized protein n=1 Tax=Sediminibacillus albus TaxID=407036 RepID=A0A1G9BCY2_9BACI|nr:hypothetical protein [Sediminibacillus albus]SDK37426.1 hypothetical protein SAMN05216243_2958 [Sediminibacillus albus]
MNLLNTFAEAIQLELFDDVQEANKWLKSNAGTEVIDIKISSSSNKILIIWKDL